MDYETLTGISPIIELKADLPSFIEPGDPILLNKEHFIIVNLIDARYIQVRFP